MKASSERSKINKLKRKIASRLLIIKDLLAFFWQNRLWWMIPIVLVFLLLTLFIAFTQSSAVIPFIYTLF